ncbi:actin binding protein, putative [Talaromyces stipitatus ATCC 10500]|uniref:tRNA N(3)-methylcytidine methyltransferase n=1 Tax=Talaromyces stipitatus (strain ATCC 10500 / CBS 375.48 / QM 6759 / NRRL 1006) TaxID=441959 RepID=B8MGE5_TALSN|nr:actin binding protein, putative [Talaromyces stipitatus ATCC 10500]EED16265.1 actin binding protein, putative [Talaromyces stipitatus ATCC 10500]
MPALPPDGDYVTISQLVEPPTIPSWRSHDPARNAKRTDPFAFGQRYLEEGDDVFSYNAWDHVETDEDYKAYAELQYAKQRENPASDWHKALYNSNPAKFWDRFYKNHNQNFFKDRKWLRQEFPVLAEVTKQGAGRKVVLEVGAGAGNTAFPLINNNENEELMLFACDYSKNAVKVMRESEHYNEKFMRAEVWDVTQEEEEIDGEIKSSLPPGVEEGSVDVVILIFIMSALAPNQWSAALRNIYRVLKPGGLVLFRDYGRGDLAQVRFRKERYLAENFYVRGDEELRKIWSTWTSEKGLTMVHSGNDSDSSDRYDKTENLEGNQTEDNPERTSDETADKQREQKLIERTDKTGESVEGAFEVLNLGKDQRLLVNRQRRLKMYRCWLQARFRKRVVDNSGESQQLAPTAESIAEGLAATTL